MCFLIKYFIKLSTFLQNVLSNDMLYNIDKFYKKGFLVKYFITSLTFLYKVPSNQKLYKNTSIFTKFVF